MKRIVSHKWHGASPRVCHWTFSAKWIRMVDRVISSMDFHSSIVIKVGFLLWRITSTCLLIINTSCIISFHRAKFLPSNFLILIPVSDVEAMFISGWDWPDLLLSVVKVLLLSFVYSGFSSRLCSKLLWYHLWECRGLAGACRRIWDIVQGKWHTEKEREMFSSFNGKLQGYTYSLE